MSILNIAIDTQTLRPSGNGMKNDAPITLEDGTRIWVSVYPPKDAPKRETAPAPAPAPVKHVRTKRAAPENEPSEVAALVVQTEAETDARIAKLEATQNEMLVLLKSLVKK